MDKLISISVASIKKLGDVTQVITTDGREISFPTRYWVSHGRKWVRMTEANARKAGLVE